MLDKHESGNRSGVSRSQETISTRIAYIFQFAF